ncbi:hypothetical protein [Clostridium beijerinckii]|uniref:hypothetical protein n=1 Tax=Clostridium beijerinckii TaxID=1520 RepID=UPI001F34B2CF|nr:hypothetical protein [Clostridium beijerinckii]
MISNKEADIIGQKAIRTFGGNTQIIKAIEECGELVQALSKHLIGPNPNMDNICEEIADVEIMIMQLRHLFPTYKIDEWKDKKLKRLEGVVW